MARITSPGASPTRAAACRSTVICSCGRPVSASARRSLRPSTPDMIRSADSASFDSSSRSGPNTRTEMSAGVPPSPSSIRIPRGVVNSTAMPGKRSSRSRMSSSIAASSRSRSGFNVTSTSDSVWGIGSSVRSARPVRRTTSSTSGTERSTSSTRWFSRSTSSREASFGSTVWSRKAPSSSCGMKSLPTNSPRARDGAASSTVTRRTSRGCARQRSRIGRYRALIQRKSQTSSSAPGFGGRSVRAATIGTTVTASTSEAAIAAITAAARG